LLDQHQLLYSSSFGLLYVLCENKHISSLLRKWGESNYLVSTGLGVKGITQIHAPDSGRLSYLASID
jgi:hypothetical protein